MGTGAVKRSSLETISTRRKKWCPVWNGGTKHTAHDWEIFTQQTEGRGVGEGGGWGASPSSKEKFISENWKESKKINLRAV